VNKTTITEALAYVFTGFVAGYLVAALVVAKHWGWLP